MKKFMDIFKEKIDEMANPDYSTFSKYMLCYVTTNDAQWAVENLDQVLFRETYVHETKKF